MIADPEGFVDLLAISYYASLSGDKVGEIRLKELQAMMPLGAVATIHTPTDLAKGWVGDTVKVTRDSITSLGHASDPAVGVDIPGYKLGRETLY